MTAQALIDLPEEDAAELAERVDGWLRDLGARNEVEESLIRHAATLSWKLDRGDRHEAAVLTRRIQERAEVELAEFRDRVIVLAEKLIPSPEEFQETGFDRAPAAELVRAIESTAEGCSRLLRCWDLVRQAAERAREWISLSQMALFRLLGQGHGPPGRGLARSSREARGDRGLVEAVATAQRRAPRARRRAAGSGQGVAGLNLARWATSSSSSASPVK